MSTISGRSCLVNDIIKPDMVIRPDNNSKGWDYAINDSTNETKLRPGQAADAAST
jgi:hypothetical protein